MSAFTVAELGEMLPDEYPGDSESILMCFKVSGGKEWSKWYVRYQKDDLEETIHTEFAGTEADARAKMLIYLLENNLLTPNTKE